MELLDEKNAARMLGCSVGLLRKWRQSGEGPAYCRLGRLVRYRDVDLSVFLVATRVEGRA